MLRRLVGEDLLLETRLAPDLGLVKADRGQLQQILLNLVINARDSMPEGGPVTIETYREYLSGDQAQIYGDVAPGEYIVLAVRDAGTGMNAEILTHLFEPFYTTKELGEGTGLGLTTCYGIAKTNGGNLGVVSTPGRGTTMRLYLPRVEAEPRPEPAEVPAVRGGDETILLVEDDPLVRATTASMLRAYGYTVIEAGDAEEGFAQHREQDGQIQLVITDVVLPGKGARRLADRIQLVDRALPVLFMTGYNEDVVPSHRAGDAEVYFIRKPFAAPDLAQRVREVLDV